MLKKFISIFIVPSITTITFLFAQNHSLSFDGSNDYVINSSLSGFNFSSTNEITIETWFMMESHSGYDGIVSMNADGIKYRMMVNPGMHPFYDAGMHYDVAVSDFAFSLNTWYHYALVIRGGGNAEVYVDGTLISSNPTGVPGSLPDASQILIGNGEGPGVHSSNAIIDECRIWNKALSSEEIQFYMSTSPENNESGLVGYWNFNEGEGSILSDKTSNGNDCTIHGSSWSYSIPPTLGEISDNDLLIETHDLLFTEHSLIESSQLEVGKKYYLKISGTYNVHGCCARFDAAYEYVDSNPPNPYREKWSWNGETNQIPYPSAYSPDHVYYFYFEGTGNSEVFMFQDEGGYGDNSGSLSIEIWERGNSDQETETNNYSLSFDGQDDYVYFGNILDVGTSSFSYGMWLKLRNLNASWQQNIMSKARSQGGYKFDVEPNTNYLRANFEVAGTDQYISAYSDPIEEDKWYYATVVVNRDSNNMKIYLDGNLQSSVDIYDQSYDITNTGTFRLAHNHWNNHPNSHEGPKAEFMDGQLSNFSFWGKPLSKEEINNIMHSELTGSEQDLLGYWKLDEGNGSSILDLTSSSNHGQISGASWVEDVPPKPSITSIEITGSSGFRILSSPVSGNIYADLLEELWTQGMAGSDDPDHGSANVWTWSDGNWQSVIDLNNDFYSAGNGILVYVFADADFNGIEDDFPIIISLDSSAHSRELMVSTSANDFNLLGNPYGHSLKISSLLADNDDFYSTIYIWDNATSAYRTHNGLTGDISDGVIAPFQGFWVESKDAGSTFSFNESSISSLRGVNYRTVIDSTGSSSITFTNGESTNSLHFSFNLNGQIDHDDADAYRLLPLSKKDHIASMFYNGSRALSIKNLPYDFNADLGIDLDVLMLEKSDVGFETIDEEISMTWDFSAMPQGISVILRDNLTNQFLNMNEASHHEITTQSKGGFETDLNQVLTYPLLGQSRFTIYLSGATAFSGQDHLIPKEFALHPAYPNPFNPSTSIDYDIHEAGLVTLRIYDMLGREVEELINKVILPGKYSTKWNTSDKISSGVYLVRITNGEKVFNQKITLIK